MNRGEIWVGTDDGYVQMTRDSGLHWSNVTPPGTPEFARIETVAPSPLVAGTAYAVADNHRMGDYAPYLFVTHDYGATWSKIVNGLPGDQYVRTVRPDTKNPYLLYGGTENGMWISFDGGAHWQDFRINLPTVSVRDIRIAPEFGDLVVATHGRDTWILDDLGSIRQLGDAQRAGLMLFCAADRLRVPLPLERPGHLHALCRRESTQWRYPRLLPDGAAEGCAVAAGARLGGPRDSHGERHA